MLQQLTTISRNTFIESIRQPIATVLIIGAGLVLTLAPSLSMYSLEDDNRLMVDMGFSTLFLVSILLSAFTAASVLSNEIESRTVMTVVSKPVSRPVFILGKFVGVAAALAVAYWILTIVFLLTVRHKVMQTASDPFDGPVILFGALAVLISLVGAGAGNYFYRWVFTSSFVMSLFTLLTGAYLLVLVINKDWQFQSIVAEFHDPDVNLRQLLVGLLLLFEAVLMLAAVAIACSTRLGRIMTLVIVSGFFVLGLVSDFFFGRFAQRSTIADVFYRIIPNMQFFWPGDALSQNHPITGNHLVWVSSYAVFYLAAILALAVALFQTREVG